MAEARPTSSIALRLIAAVLAVELVSAVLVVFVSLGYERHTHFRAFDIMLRGRADSMLVAVQDSEDAQANVILNQANLHLPPDDVYEVYDQNGRLLGRSNNWQGTPAGEWANPADGYLRLRVGHHSYRVLRLHGSRFVDSGEPGGGKLRPVTIIYGAETEHVWRDIRGAVEFYAGGSLLLLLVTGPLIAWLLHRGLLPLRQLAALAAGVSVDSWDFSPPASARTTPELAPLTRAIESVLARLERSFVQQRTFVSDAAHELKTALAVVKSSLQLMNMRERSAAEYQAGVDRVLADTQRLEEIVAKMLTLARVESTGAAGPAAATCDMAAGIVKVMTELEPVARLRQVTVDASGIPEGDCTVGLSGEDCGLLISNLLLNAIEHSPAQSTLYIRMAETPAEVELAIEDHGEGIDPAVLGRVFDRFYRADPSRARGTGGTGLGLAIAKAIVDRAGGQISLESQPGQGTTATVRLPRG